jgi:hypothetical protein
MTRENPDTFAQLYVYDRKSLLSAFSDCLTPLCGEGGEWRLKVLTKEGIKQIKKRKALAEVFDKVATAFPDGFNQLEIVGLGSSELLANEISQIKFAYTPSPLNKDWAPIGDVQREGYTRPTWHRIISLSSREGFVFGHRLKRHPGFLSIEVSYPNEKRGASRERLLQLFRGMIRAVGVEYNKGYIGYIDPRPLMPAATVMGGRVTDAPRMDTFFDMPHMMVFGPSAVLDKYASAMCAAYPKLDMITELIGSATVVAFKDLAEVSRVYSPELHSVHP